MATRSPMGQNTFETAIERMIAVYEQGHRVVVSFSAGKDSTCALEVCVMAAKLTGRLPVEVVLRDEEINFPGTYEYALRTAKRPEIKFNWLIANQPVVNVFNREAPYFWVFDPLLPPEKWVRQPPTDPAANVTYITDLNIESMTIPARFPPPPDKGLMAVIGLRVQESRGRLYGLFSSKGYVTNPNKFGVRNVRPIYDWSDADVWKAISDNKWDYNAAYDTMYRMGVKRKDLRIAPPTMNAAGLGLLTYASQAWPQWFDKVADRLQGVRTAAMFGKRSVTPQRQLGETWEECYHRLCTEDAPPWIRARATHLKERMLSAHTHHSTTPLPEISPCRTCYGNIGSWKSLTMIMYTGDPFSVKTPLPYVEPEFFRPGAGKWGGKASF